MQPSAARSDCIAVLRHLNTMRHALGLWRVCERALGLVAPPQRGDSHGCHASPRRPPRSRPSPSLATTRSLSRRYHDPLSLARRSQPRGDPPTLEIRRRLGGAKALSKRAEVPSARPLGVEANMCGSDTRPRRARPYRELSGEYACVLGCARLRELHALLRSAFKSSSHLESRAFFENHRSHRKTQRQLSHSEKHLTIWKPKHKLYLWVVFGR